MSFNLDFALFYAYTLCLFAFIVLWLIPMVFRALADSFETWIQRRDGVDDGPESAPPQTRFEAFTRT